MIYMSGFGNTFETESIPGALPKGQNSPQKCPFNLYAEQLSGSPFSAPNNVNERSWLYRLRPSVKHSMNYTKINKKNWKTAPHQGEHNLPIGQYRWNPLLEEEPCEFIDGVKTITVSGDVNVHNGMASNIYIFNKSMKNTVFTNADAEMLFIPYSGSICLFTEMGKLRIKPGQIAVLPRGISVKISTDDEISKGYLCENYGSKFNISEKGIIGANCLANPRDFKIPVAAYEELENNHSSILKWCGSFYKTEIKHSPLDVVAWHGNYTPYLYNLNNFSPIGSTNFDHPDPSIYSVLTSKSETLGTSNIDFIVFPERWSVAENTFRPPWYHKNIMSEFMGLIYGEYDARPNGFFPGGISLHNMMLPHGPDYETFQKASNEDLKPHKFENSLAFMFETRYPQHVTKFASVSNGLQKNYIDCWRDIEKNFDVKE